MDLAIERDPDGTPVVVLTGELDMATSSRLRACLAVQDGPLVVDLADVTFLDSSALAVFNETQLRLGGTLRLRDPSPFVRRVLAIAALDHWIEDGQPLPDPR